MCNDSAEKICESAELGVSRDFFSRKVIMLRPLSAAKTKVSTEFRVCRKCCNLYISQDLQKKFRALESENKVFIEKAESTIILYSCPRLPQMKNVAKCLLSKPFQRRARNFPESWQLISQFLEMWNIN